MKLGEIWDYIMRRKARFLVLGAVLFLIIAGISRLVTKNQPINSVDNLAAETYNNSLVLKIADPGAKSPSYQLTFVDDYTKAVVRVTDEALTSEAYVRIFDSAGNLLYGEYTTIEDATPVTPTTDAKAQAEELKTEELEEPDSDEEDSADEAENTVVAVVYRFLNTPKNYEVALEPGSMIEIRSTAARFVSTLDNAEATAFRPEGTERYIVGLNGLRKENWSEAKGLAENYQLLKRFLVQKIEDYQAKVSEEVLSDKELDQAAKMKVVAAYNSLAEADQAEYQEFIGFLLNGKPAAEEPPTEEPEGPEAPGTSEEKPGETVTPPSVDKNEPVVVPETPSVVIEEVVLPNDPVSSVNHQSLMTFGGRTDTEVAASQDATQTIAVGEPASEEPVQKEPQVARPTTINNSQTSTSSSSREESSAKEMPLWQKIALVAVGIVILILLVRFIFDHYVR